MTERRLLSLALAVGLAGIALGRWANPERAWASLLVGGFFVLSLCLGALLFWSIQEACGARWSAAIMPKTLLLTRGYGVAATAVFAALAMGTGSFHGWAHEAHGGHGVDLPHGWLSAPFVLARAAVFLLVWGGLIAAMRRRLVSASETSRVLPAATLIIVAVTFSLAAFDWLMALEPLWYSTLFAIYVFSGQYLGALAAVTILVLADPVADRMKSPASDDLRHDLGKLIFGFSLFWAYLWYCQYLLIWYSNVPEETTFFLARHSGGWAVLSFTCVLLNWLAPFVVLLSRSAKRNPRVLRQVSLVVLAGHWLDLYILVMPRFAGSHPLPTIGDVLATIGVVAAAALAIRHPSANSGARIPVGGLS